MDPFTTISLVTNILTFVEFSAKVLKGASEIYRSPTGTLEDNRSREISLSQMQEFSLKLLAPDKANFMGEDKQLCILAEECRVLSRDFIDLLGKIKAKDPTSKSQSFWSSVKSRYYENEKQSLEERLDGCRKQLELQLNYVTR
jgi:hypothetical protein